MLVNQSKDSLYKLIAFIVAYAPKIRGAFTQVRITICVASRTS